uniref:Solute carrier family 2 member 10 n=2 Tax=Rhinopithecus TaxID=542827 RepID=A0A2K6JNV5_RHIBE
MAPTGAQALSRAPS